MKASFGEKIFYAINMIILGVIGITCFLPLLHITAVSLSDYDSVLSGHVTLFPKGFNFTSYIKFFESGRAGDAVLNSIKLMVVGVPISMVMTILAAYPLSRKYFFLRRHVSLALVFTMMFGAGTIPMFLLIYYLGMMNTYFAIWIPGCIVTFYVFIMKSFFENLPEELFEAAKMDGCGEFRLVLQIVLPLSMSVIATILLFYLVANWNTFTPVLFYIQDPDKFNLPVLVQNMIRSSELIQEMNLNSNGQDYSSMMTPESVRSAGVIILLLPMLAAYPFLQKYFIKGVMIGAIKG